MLNIYNKKHFGVVLHCFGIIVVTWLLLFQASNVALAQDKFSITVRGGINLPCQGQNNLSLNNGYGLEGEIGYRVLSQLSVYAGWGYNNFDVKDDYKGSDVDFVASGYSLGLQFNQPVASSGLSIIVGGGALYHELKVECENSDFDDSKRGLGYQIDLGLGINIGKNLMLIPGLKYRSIERDYDMEGRSKRIDLNYLSAGAGIGWFF
ncbi:outer membrane beta-barrel protein [Pontibacter cellulosilyticus]|uniref:Outer membrane beta-barrel protein n=1 Tax=Pontibacter cellulosilyticus TaxID=1720253 RepID=A0A923N853_9BACT|nr:outer membrane beta-barrel protein [Pontibacter cellulosilyticus]MBC5992225.1 outer membrane beta-barrel protein [Pontibacter cellulosilyticus]